MRFTIQDYSSERGNPTDARCGSSLSLTFNGAELKMNAGKGTYKYKAVSGKPVKGKFDYSENRQKQKGVGPIPSGSYWIKPDELWENAWYKRGPTSSWGNYRITIHPRKGTITHGRGGFFIHGGDSPGSAGCIDLTTKIDQFIKDLKKLLGTKSSCYIPLTVSY